MLPPQIEAPPHPGRLTMLRKLEKYEILDEIGHGGMATVYRARDSRLDRPVALKIMHPHLRGAHEARVRFTREAQSVARLKHDNILEIYDNSDPDSEEAYIVTELLTGPTLKEFAEKNREMPAEVAACFGILIAQALGCAHEAGIVHRDVKPENVLLHEDRTLKLTDFGIAQMIDSNSFTATGQILGSPGHMAPEQIESGSSDQRTDLFALGTVIYYLATGRLPFEGKNPHQVLKRIVDGAYAHPLRVRPTVGGTLSRIIEKALATNPDDRYQSAKELEDDLTRFVSDMGIDDPAALLAKYMKDPEGAAEKIRETTIARLITLGKQATERGEIPVALDAYNRVLALDDGNDKVLHLIENIGKRGRNKQILMGTGVVVALAAIGALAYGWGGKGQTVDETSDGSVMVAGVEDAAVDAVGVEDAAVVVAADADVDTGRSVSAMGIVSKVQPPVLRGPREVLLLPTPADVEIAIDDQEFRDFGPDFQHVTLSPGRHRVRMRGTCCDEVDFPFVVPPGPANEPIRLSRTLPFKPAQLNVIASVEGEVSVNGERIGNTHTYNPVPMERMQERVQISVTSPGYRAYTTFRTLRAGEPETVADVTLVEASGSSP